MLASWRTASCAIGRSTGASFPATGQDVGAVARRRLG